MPNYQHILFPIDFSPQIDAAIPYVAAMARHLDAKVTLLSVVPEIWAGRGPRPEYASELEDTTKQRLDRALIAEVQGLTVERVVRSGEAAEQIVRFSREQAVDLIMMPTHGHGRFRSLLLGSVTGKVLHDAHCPLWTAAHAAEQRARHLPQTILCCVDGTPASAELIRQAVEFSGRLGAVLRLLHVVPSVSDFDAFAGDRRIQDEENALAYTRLDTLCREAGVTVPFEIAIGPIAATAAGRASEEAADLLMIGRGKIGATLGRLRTHTQGIIQHSPCPVLSL
jgi:nucleotide-binding universal stress UspA family protein